MTSAGVSPKIRTTQLKLVLVIATISVSAGCGPRPKEPLPICPGAVSIDQSLHSLRLHNRSATPLKANGQCRLVYHDEKGKLQKENFPIKLWVSPPHDVYMQGDVAFDPKAIILGANKTEFWLTIRPDRISTYWWGKWAEQSRLANLPLSPRILLEALGVVDIQPAANYSLQNRGPYDILTQTDDNKSPVKKIYAHTCDYLVRKIEYCGEDGCIVAVAELENYHKIAEGFSVPRLITVTSPTDHQKNAALNSVRIELRSPKPTELGDRQRKLIFSRPRAHGFQHEFVIIDGKPVELQR